MSESLFAPAGKAGGADCWTRREILQQPDMLRATQVLLLERQVAIEAFLRPLLANPALRIVLTGAGTSAFIGECIAPALGVTLARPVEAIATTDIVATPDLYLQADRPTLLVSFGRSGNSPESIAAIALADEHLRSVHHLIVTCNLDGALAQIESPLVHAIVLPQATHDRGFAMTSSFSAMMFAAVAIFTGASAMKARTDAIANAVTDALHEAEPQAAALARLGFERVVYLGSGVFKGLAREASLKLLELTDGAIVTVSDTPMGFRHGPKTVLNAHTLVIIFLSNDPLTRRYDIDMFEELRRDGRCGAVISIAAGEHGGDGLRVRHLEGAADVDLLFPFIVPAQLLGFHASLTLGLAPDRPNTSGTVSRVVQGVRIHAAAG